VARKAESPKIGDGTDHIGDARPTAPAKADRPPVLQARPFEIPNMFG